MHDVVGITIDGENVRLMVINSIRPLLGDSSNYCLPFLCLSVCLSQSSLSLCHVTSYHIRDLKQQNCLKVGYIYQCVYEFAVNLQHNFTTYNLLYTAETTFE